MQRSPKATFELVPKCGTESFNLREFKLPAFSSPWHFHPEYELTNIVNGTGSRFVGDSIAPYGPGDLALIGADLPHVWRSDAPAMNRADYAHSVWFISARIRSEQASSSPGFTPQLDPFAGGRIKAAHQYVSVFDFRDLAS